MDFETLDTLITNMPLQFPEQKVKLLKGHINSIQKFKESVDKIKNEIDNDNAEMRDLLNSMIKTEQIAIRNARKTIQQNFPIYLSKLIINEYLVRYKRNARKEKSYFKVKYVTLRKNRMNECMPDDCPVCFKTELIKDSVLTDCNHQFCFTCFHEWKKTHKYDNLVSCPTCRNHCKGITAYKLSKSIK